MTDIDEFPPLLPQAPTRPTTTPPGEALPFQRAEPTNFTPRPGDIDEGEARLRQAPTSLIEPRPGEVAREETPLEEELRRAAELMQSEPTVFASVSNRRTTSSSAATARDSVLIATWRERRGSVTRYTCPIPPVPSRAEIS